MDLKQIYKDKNVVISGHSGFKGSWLAFTLNWLGANVFGFSIDVPKNKNHAYFALDIPNLVNKNSIITDSVCESSYQNFLSNTKPDFIFHLAAQAIVKESLINPYKTIETNVLGVLNLLEYLRNEALSIPTVIVTSDKCYKNLNTSSPYIETDELSGDDPYSASKAAAEIVFKAYQNSFFKASDKPVSTVRAGNVFGGGDWSNSRLITDCVSQILSAKEISLRMPTATRPWTFVHDVLHGYLILGARLLQSPAKFSGSWNFASGEEMTVENVARILISKFDSYCGNIDLKFIGNTFKEHSQLQIDATKAHSELGWICRESLAKSLSKTAEWYIKQDSGVNMQSYSEHLLETFFST